MSGATANGSMRFADFVEKYMTEYATLYLKPKTIATYTENLRRINQAIGHIKLSELRTGHINSFYRNLQEEGIRWRALMTFDLLSGLRRGELLGLRWQDVDFDDHTITIRQTSNYLPGKGVYVSIPKTAGSARPLMLSTAAIMMLLEYKQWQDRQREAVGDLGGSGQQGIHKRAGRSSFPRQHDAVVQQLYRTIWYAEGHSP